jgi:MSHA biogenesis protein MshJ
MSAAMKQRLTALSARVDALSLRERALVFAAAVAVVGFAGQQLVLAPIYRQQDVLQEQIDQQRNNMAGIDAEIVAKVTAYQNDPDAASRTRLESVKRESAQLADSLLAMQHGLVPPERMAPLVDAILRANGRLQLVSMRTLPVETISGRAATAAGATPAAAPAAAEAARAPDMLYRHGVEVTVRGNYLDMVNYMSALEAMPTRLFWGKAQLDVEEYPASRLTLTLYTLSLDRNWMKL